MNNTHASGTTTSSWRISSFSGANTSCVAIATLTDGHVAMRNSNHPDDGTIYLAPDQIRTLITHIKTGELDHHA